MRVLASRGPQVLRDPRGDRLRVAPGHQGVDEPIGELRDLILGKAHAAQVRRVAAAARDHEAERPARKRSGLLGVRLDGDELPDNERGIVAEQRTRLRGVLGRDEKRVCAGAAVSGQLEHAGPQGRQHAGSRRHRTMSRPGSVAWTAPAAILCRAGCGLCRAWWGPLPRVLHIAAPVVAECGHRDRWNDRLRGNVYRTRQGPAPGG
jgi:hypothetical protein